MTTTSVLSSDEVEAFGRAIKAEQVLRKRAAIAAEIRRQILVTLTLLSRYERRYELVLSNLLDEWRAI